MAFYTEKRTEDFLAEETRCLEMPSGVKQRVTGTRLMWRHFDFAKDEFHPHKVDFPKLLPVFKA